MSKKEVKTNAMRMLDLSLIHIYWLILLVLHWLFQAGSNNVYEISKKGVANLLQILVNSRNFSVYSKINLNKEQKKNVQYDAYAKYILSQKEVLVQILKFTIAEFQDLEAEESDVYKRQEELIRR